MTSEDARGGRTDHGAADPADEPDAGPSAVDEHRSEDAAGDRQQRPLLAGLLGLVAGIAGGIAGTTIAPNSLLLTIVLVVGVAGVVTLGALRLFASR